MFKKLYFLEHLFSWYQFSNIINFFEIQSFNHQIIKKKFNQTSNAYSYYILKPIIAIRFFDILSQIKYINKLIYNHNHKHKHNQIINIIKSCIKNKPVILINQLINQLDYKLISLRMSLLA